MRAGMKIRWLALLAFSVVAGTPALAQNLIVNGDFSQGNTGFSTDYFFTSSAINVQQYCINTNIKLCHPAALDIFDHTTGTGLMDAVNAASAPGKKVWVQTVPVSPATDHMMSVWVTSWGNINGFDPSPAVLRFTINGVPIAPDYNADPQDGKWTEFTAIWNSGSSTFATIEIEDLNLAATGNDFALDDLSLTPGASTGGGLGGTVSGMTPRVGKVLCKNLTTGKVVRIVLAAGATTWDCEQAGLQVSPGDKIRMLVAFDGPAN